MAKNKKGEIGFSKISVETYMMEKKLCSATGTASL
jgi:hypothetical protein